MSIKKEIGHVSSLSILLFTMIMIGTQGLLPFVFGQDSQLAGNKASQLPTASLEQSQESYNKPDNVNNTSLNQTENVRSNFSGVGEGVSNESARSFELIWTKEPPVLPANFTGGLDESNNNETEEAPPILRTEGPIPVDPEVAKVAQLPLPGFQTGDNGTNGLTKNQPPLAPDNLTNPVMSNYNSEDIEKVSFSSVPQYKPVTTFQFNPSNPLTTFRQAAVTSPTGMPVVCGTPNFSCTMEPAVANNGNMVFLTGNWFAARSLTGVNYGGWEYANVAPSSLTFLGYNLCCDQDVIYDPHFGIFIWYMQGNANVLSDPHSFRIAVSSDLVHWRSWDIAATGFDSSWTIGPNSRLFWDFPHLALSNNYLFISTNVFVRTYNPTTGLSTNPTTGMPLTPNGYFASAVIRISLNQLATSNVINLGWIFDRIALGLAQGATNEMFIAGHISDRSMKIYRWPDSVGSNGVQQFTKAVYPWLVGGQFNCRNAMAPPPPSTGTNPCAFLNGRPVAQNQITNGWIHDGKVGFFWNVAQGCTTTLVGIILSPLGPLPNIRNACFNFPYVDSAEFRTSDLTYINRPFIFNNGYAWVDAFASPSDRGIGWAAWKVGGNTLGLRVWAGVHDNLNPEPPGWRTMPLSYFVGTGGISRLGDYLRVRPFSGESSFWIGSGYSFNDAGQIVPEVYVFGRTSDIPAFERIR